MKTKDIMDNFSGKILIEKVLRLKSFTHQNIVVTSSPGRNGSLSSWCVPPSGFGVVRYTSGYWKWIEDVLARNKETLERNKTFFASLFTYDHNENMLQAFYENWRPSTNIVSTFIGELSISLWDLQNIEGLYVHGSFYDEVIPSAKELTYVDDKGMPFLFRSCSYLISAFYRLTKDGVAGSTMPLANLAHQLGLVDISSNIFGDDVFGEDCITSPNPSSVLKVPNLSLDNAMT
ncbi:hypothetical protein CQW23_01875 [Capsicum baccatum]|uniref:Aminotransferase-like plant mobile domain-containing protein n=1 Tax=Capsicum baccatum TaxID=33114 RepID=A0A2G2XPT4_CAPBA|nr:hypothetical protein CQW23_01875 [Capsicum baccatum]